MPNRIEAKEFLDLAHRQNWINDEERALVQKEMADGVELLVSEILHDAHLLDHDAFLRMLSAELQCEYLPPDIISAMDFPDALIQRVGIDALRINGVVPLAFDESNDKLLVLSAYPFNPLVLQELPDFFSVAHVELAFCMETQVREILDDLQKNASADQFIGGSDDDGGFFLGSEDEEDAFPGLYGQGLSDEFFDEPLDETLEGSPDAPPPRKSKGVQGDLEDLGLMDMLQALGQSRKTATVKFTRGAEQAFVFMTDGQVVHCIYADKSGEDAFFELMAWTTGFFDIQPDEYLGEQTIRGSIDSLLLEGFRRMDEAGR